MKKKSVKSRESAYELDALRLGDAVALEVEPLHRRQLVASPALGFQTSSAATDPRLPVGPGCRAQAASAPAGDARLE